MNPDSKTEKNGRKEREFKMRRAEILSAAVRLFAGQGFHNTTMNMIAKEAEFSTGSLYGFFKSKEELYFTLLREELEKLEADVRKRRDQAQGTRSKLEAVVDTLVDYFDANRDFFRIFATQQDHFEWPMKGEFAEVVRAKYLSFIAELALVFKEGIGQGIFKPYEPEELAMCFMGIMNSFIFLWIETEPKLRIGEKKKAILDIFYDGVGPAKESLA